MKKDNFTITLDKLNAIIPIFASEFCDMNGVKDEDLIMKGVWETSPFYAANFNAPCISLVVGEEKLDELSFQVTSVNPL